MSSIYLPEEIWSIIKSYLLLDEPSYEILLKLSKYSVSKLLLNFKFEPKQLKTIKDTTINILRRKKYILKLLLLRSNKNEINSQIQLINKQDSEKYDWLQDFRVGEEILCYDFIIFENRKRSVRRKAVIVKIGIKFLGVKFYNYQILPKNDRGRYPMEWKLDFENKTKLIFDKNFVQRYEPYHSGIFRQGLLYIF